METGAIEYTAPAGLNLSKLRKALSDQFTCSPMPSHKVRCTYLDTFDWRVYSDGAVLELTPQKNKLSVTWTALNGSTRLGPVVLDHQPRFVEDISLSPLRRRLSPVVEMRALLPQFEVLREVETLALLNRDRKTLVRIQLVSESVSESYKGKPLDTINYLKVIPLRGYGKSSEQAVRVLSGVFELAEVEGDFIRRTLARVDRLPGDPSKLRVDLSPEMRSDTAMKQVLLRLLNTIDVNEAGTRTNIDTEFLHDFRVAVRRTRAVFTQVKRVFATDDLERFIPELKWLGGITGPTRDLDVYLLTFDEYKNSLPEFQRDHLEPLRHFLRVHQKMEQEKMATLLGSSRYREFKREWREFLESPDPETTILENAARPVVDVVSRRIQNVYKMAVKEGRAIGPDTPAEALHNLRKTCKKLRYLMENFQALYLSSDLNRLIRALKVLQENLGDFQDLEVQAMTLRRFGQQMMDEDHVGVDTLFVMGTLIVGLQKRQQRARRAFSVCFEEFDCAEIRTLFKEIFADQSTHTVAA